MDTDGHGSENRNPRSEKATALTRIARIDANSLESRKEGRHEFHNFTRILETGK
jgi:hypothetical protein